ncbi:MAG: nucleotidyltransferase family protein [Terriglobales bacterium]
MKAMVFAAGLGTRLRPLTNDRPKALVEVGGRTLLEITLSRLRSFGVREVIVNVHHYADMVIEYLHARENFGMRIEISREDVLLDTGGGLKKAAWFFLEDAVGREPFIVHNVDVISMVDVRRMVNFHAERDALVTLAVQERPTSRYLLFDQQMQLCGRQTGRDGNAELVRDSSQARPLAFAGIHVISPRLLSRITEEGAFPIIPVYLRLSAEGEKIQGLLTDAYWRDLGKPEHVAQAAADLNAGRLSL